MKVVVQRVKEASCTVDAKITGKIEQGYMLLVGFSHEDNEETAMKVATKISKLRIFEDADEKMNLSIFDVNGSILSISQFTLLADIKKGNRPSFVNAMQPDRAKELYLYFNRCLEELGLHVETGIFGADMKIALINDGPVTILVDSGEL